MPAHGVIAQSQLAHVRNLRFDSSRLQLQQDRYVCYVQPVALHQACRAYPL